MKLNWNTLINQLELQEEITSLKKQGLTDEEILGYIEFADIIVQELLETAGIDEA